MMEIVLRCSSSHRGITHVKSKVWSACAYVMCACRYVCAYVMCARVRQRVTTAHDAETHTHKHTHTNTHKHKHTHTRKEGCSS
jgi:hypothetical protein